MYRNDPVVPFAAFLFGAALLLVAYLDTNLLIRAGKTVPQALSEGQLGLVVFGLVGLLYAAIGFASIWLEGQVLRPERSTPEVPSVAPVAMVILSLTLAGLSGLLVRFVAIGLSTVPLNRLVEGGVFAAIMFVAAAMLLVYAKFVLPREVIVEGEEEVPW